MTLALVPRPATSAEFLTVYNRLSVALREPQDDSGITQGVYFDALKDVPLEALTAGAETLAREPGRRFFPTTAEWRTAAQAWRMSTFRAHETEVDRVEWRHECSGCEDTGFTFHECAGGQTGACGRRRKHAAHSFVRVCPCRPTNRTYQRHHSGHV